MTEGGKNSFIAKPMGLFTLFLQGSTATHVAMFENVMPGRGEVVGMFDLKGSRRNRSAVGKETVLKDLSSLSPTTIYKDMDLLQVGAHVSLRPEERALVVEQLSRDSQMLQRIHSMDYSLLLGFTNMKVDEVPRHLTHRAVFDVRTHTPCFLGIIDYAQKYNMRKRLERLSAKISSPNVPSRDRSCVDPKLYQARFHEFLQTVLVEAEPRQMSREED